MLSLFAAAASLPFSKQESTQWMVLGVGVLATFYVIMRPRMRGKKSDPMARQPTPMSLAQQRQVERDISNLMVEMLETARQMTAQLDTRSTRLELLIRQADERLDQLKSSPAPSTAGGALTPTDPPAAGTSDAGVDSGPRLQAPVESPAPETRETPPDPRHAEIYTLADQGRSPHEIARSLDRPNGEVELILALRRP